MLLVPEASVPAVLTVESVGQLPYKGNIKSKYELCCEMSDAGMRTSAKETE